MRTALSEQGFTPEFAAKTLMGAMRATVVRVLPNRKGKPVPHKFPDHRTRMQGFDRAWDMFGGNKPSEQELIDHQLYGADRERLLAPLNRKNWSESDKQELAEFERFSPADRMLVREGLEAVRRYVEIGGNLADLKRSLGIGSPEGPFQAGSRPSDRQPSAPWERDHKQ